MIALDHDAERISRELADEVFAGLDVDARMDAVAGKLALEVDPNVARCVEHRARVWYCARMSPPARVSPSSSARFVSDDDLDAIELKIQARGGFADQGY